MNTTSINLIQFLTIYLLLAVTLGVMKLAGASQTRILIVASIRMTIQLILAGLILTAIFQHPHPALSLGYLACMVAFAITRTLRTCPGLCRPFQAAIAASIALSGVGITAFFVVLIAGRSVTDPQYLIPISGMVVGNTMTGVTLGLKSFLENMRLQRARIETMLNLGVHPREILRPMAVSALETALLPTLNSMLGMGVVSLPGMMTGQILAGTLPLTAIIYQIAIMIAITAAVCLCVTGALFGGYRTLYNSRCQILFF